VETAEDMAQPAPLSPDEAAKTKFLEDVPDIANRDMSVVDMSKQTATINGTHYSLPEYVGIDASLERMRTERRHAMTRVRWHAHRLVYGGGDDREEAALAVAINSVNALDDGIASMRAAADQKHASYVSMINHLKGEVMAVDRQEEISRIDKALAIAKLQKTIKETREGDVPLSVYAVKQVAILPASQSSPSPSVQQTGGGNQTDTTASISRYDTVKSKLLCRRRRKQNGTTTSATSDANRRSGR
jgi:hypothetical protein